MFDVMNNLYKDDLENSTQGCEDANVRKHSMLLHKEISSQEAIEDNVKEVEVQITTLNGIASSFKGFVLEGISPMEEYM